MALYESTQALNGTWTIKGVPVFLAHDRGDHSFTEAWLAEAVRRSQERSLRDDYQGPLTFEHTDDGRHQVAGKFVLTHVAPIMYDGGMVPAAHATLTGIRPEDYAEIQSGRYSYLSPEVLPGSIPEKTAEVSTVSLLSSKVPFWRLTVKVQDREPELVSACVADVPGASIYDSGDAPILYSASHPEHGYRPVLRYEDDVSPKEAEAVTKDQILKAIAALSDEDKAELVAALSPEPEVEPETSEAEGSEVEPETSMADGEKAEEPDDDAPVKGAGPVEQVETEDKVQRSSAGDDALRYQLAEVTGRLSGLEEQARRRDLVDYARAQYEAAGIRETTLRYEALADLGGKAFIDVSLAAARRQMAATAGPPSDEVPGLTGAPVVSDPQVQRYHALGPDALRYAADAARQYDNLGERASGGPGHREKFIDGVTRRHGFSVLTETEEG